jgi:UDP-glucose 4-epimerase
MSRQILVTGANGFVGQHLCADLLTRGWAVRAAVRDVDRAVVPAGVQVVAISDPLDASSWRSVANGCTEVVHLIAKTHGRAVGNIEEFRTVNVAITAALLDALGDQVRRFCYLSSIKAVGEGSDRPYTEDVPCTPVDSYGVSKAEAERLVLASAHGTRSVVVRPPLVYGPGVGGNFLRLMEAVWKRRPLPVGRVSAQRSMIYVRNLTDAIVRTLEHDAAPGEVFHVADTTPWEIRSLLQHIGQLLDRPPRLLPVPPAALLLAGRVTGRSDQVRRLTASLLVDTAKIRSTLDWRPTVGERQALEETAAWFRTAHLPTPG